MRPRRGYYAFWQIWYFVGLGQCFVKYKTIGQLKIQLAKNTDMGYIFLFVAMNSSNCALHRFITSPWFHHSITPSLHRSITPSLHHSIAPSLHHSTPALHHSTPAIHHSTTLTLLLQRQI
jgi:hypothetical protein